MEKQYIESAADTLGFSCTFCKSAEQAIDKLQQRFYQIIVVNPELCDHRPEEFIGNLRSIRGYERIPVLVASSDKDLAPSFLDKGADAYILKPFTEDQIYSHLNLFLRRQIYKGFHQSELQKRDLNLERGKIILCSASKDVLEIPVSSIETEVIVVTDENALFKTLFSHNIWIVLIGTRAKWALPLVGKIKNDEAFNVQVILLRSNQVLDNTVVEFFNQGGDDITSVNKPRFILSRQINSRVEREQYYKEKYIRALSTAAAKLPIRSESELHLNFGPFNISASHHYHEQIPGGDFYELIVLNEHQRVLLVGDVMGKKWDAWFFSLAYLGYIRSSIRTIAQQHFQEPGELLSILNDSIFRDFKLSEVFTTLSVVLIDKRSRTLSLSSAGGMPALLFSPNKSETREIKAQGALLGLSENEQYESIHLSLEEGEQLVLFTDGYLDEDPAKNGKLASFVLELKDLVDLGSAEKIDKALNSKKAIHSDDDRTLILLRSL
ncbi:MAG: fused response regulator/phosphatase [Bacteroidota bacterium]|nr:fused response regulator/phosphatase [Bacteroidota bacterium]MDX5431185.1 fused response regulator/phosphatase [Bacteroidota bacterium]